MAKSCILKPCVEDGTGKIVESKLFNSLLSQFPNNRKEAWRHYDLATNERFVADNIPNATFDEHGEINFRDYVEAVGLGEGNPTTEQALNTALQAGNYSRQEALEKVAAFNRNTPAESKYMATLRTNDNGTVSIFVAQATDLEKETLKNEVAGMNLEDKITNLLARHGVAVTKTSKGYSRYSTKNAVRNANGLYQLIEYSKNDTPVELAEEAGHFVVGAMTGTPLGNRLEALTASKEVQREILGEEYGKRDMGDSAAREVAGVLVGQALANKLEHTSRFYNLVMRVCNAAKKIFAKISGNEVKLAILEAESIAQQFAEEFINENISDADRKALQTYETLYHKEVTNAHKSLNTILHNLMELRDEFKNVDAAVAVKIDAIIKKYATDLSPESAAEFTEAMAISGILNALYELSEFARITFTDEQTGLLNDPYPGITPSIQKVHTLQAQAKNLFLFNLFSQRLDDILSVANHTYESHQANFRNAASAKAKTTPAEVRGDQTFSYTEIYSNLSTYLKGSGSFKGAVYSYYLSSARIFAANYLEQIYGKQNIARHAHLTWSLKETQDEEISFQDLVETIRQDDGGLQHLLGTLANSSDIPAQLIAKLFKENEYKAMMKKVEIQKKLSELEEEAKKLGFHNDYRRFYEVDSEGKLTGNLVRIVKLGTIRDDAGRAILTAGYYQINMHKYHEAESKMLRYLKEKFIFDSAGKKCEHLPAELKRAAFKDWARQQPEYQEFMEKHTIDFGKGKLPNPALYNETMLTGEPYITLSQQEISWLKKYEEIWKECRALVGEEKMPSYFAPQVRGTKGNTINNIMEIPTIKNKWAMAMHLTKEAWNRVWHQDPQYLDKQKHYNYGTLSADPVDQFFQEDSEAIQEIRKATSIPLYYVRKLQDATTIDTNLIAATSHFAAMAAQYNTTKEIQGSLEVTLNVLSERANKSKETLGTKLGKAVSRPRNSTESLVQKTIEDHVESIIYGRNRTWIHNRFGNKFLPIVNKALTIYYLGGNFLSQIVNLVNGYWEIFKEAFIGEHYTFDTFVKANVIYILNLPGLLYDMITVKDHTKINLFAEKFGAVSSKTGKHTESRVFFERLLSKYLNPLTYLMGGYSLAEHYMQSIPYMCMAMETKVYTKSGKKQSLWLALKPSTSWWKRWKNKDYSLDLQESVFTDPDSSKLYYDLKRTIINLEKEVAKQDSDFDIVSFLQENNYEALRLLQSYGIQKEDVKAMKLEDVIQTLTNISNTLVWNTAHETQFIAKAREITNRMHGVYNDLDKTVMHRNIVGALLLPFKGFAFGMIQRRYGGLLGGAKYSIALDNEDEGSNVSAAKIGLRTAKSIITPFTTDLYSAIKEKDINKWWRTSAKSIVQTFATVGAVTLPAGKKVRSTIAKYSGVSSNQIYNVRRSAIDYLGIYGIFHLLTMVKSLLLGEDEEENPADYNKHSAIELAKSLELFKENTSSLPEYYMTEQDLIRQMTEAAKEVRQLQAAGVQIDNRQAYIDKKVTEYIIKNVNLYYKETRAPKDNALLNLSYYVLNRFHREQSAFNTWVGLQTEGKSVLSITPISYSFARDVYDVCNNYISTYGFEEETVKVGNSTFTVKEAISKINDPSVPPKVKAIFKKAVKQAFIDGEYGTESEFSKFYYTKEAPGVIQWGDNKATSKLKKKLPHKRIQAVLRDPLKAVTDYNSQDRY